MNGVTHTLYDYAFLLVSCMSATPYAPDVLLPTLFPED